MSGSVLRMTPWVGGKGQLMWAIQPLIPVHIDKFIDVFAGGGTVTLNILLPRGCTQIYNDLNGNLYTIWRRSATRWALPTKITSGSMTY